MCTLLLLFPSKEIWKHNSRVKYFPGHFDVHRENNPLNLRRRNGLSTMYLWGKFIAAPDFVWVFGCPTPHSLKTVTTSLLLYFITFSSSTVSSDSRNDGDSLNHGVQLFLAFPHQSEPWFTTTWSPTNFSTPQTQTYC